MTIAVPSLAVAKGLVSIPHTLAFVVTIFRLLERRRMRRLWWDDYWALISLLWDTPNWLAFMLRPPNGSDEKYMSFRGRVILFWFTLVCFPLTLWSARISIGASLVRVLPPGALMRRIAFWMNVLFGLMCAGVIAQRTHTCASYSDWHTSYTVQCTFSRGSGIMNLVTDVISDFLLIAVPLISLWNVKMPDHLRRIVLLIFAASIVTALTSVLYATFLFYTRPVFELRIYVAIMSHVESAISLIICNLLVLVTYFYRRYRNGQDIESHYPSASSQQPPSYELPSQSIPGIPRRSQHHRSRAQTLTASIHFSEIFEGSEYAYDSSLSTADIGQLGLKSSHLEAITQ